jgi:hypothetical protein
MSSMSLNHAPREQVPTAFIGHVGVIHATKPELLRVFDVWTHLTLVRGSAVRMIVKPARQFAIADSAMRLNPFSFSADRFAFRPE